MNAPPLYRHPHDTVPIPPALGSGVRWAIVATTFVSTCLLVAYVATLFGPLLLRPHDVQPDFRLALAVGGGYMLSLLTHLALAAVWTYRAWSWLPPEQRFTRGARAPTSPLKAAGLLLVPYFNLYWVFMIAGGLADALERMRRDFPSSRAIVPHRLAMIAPVMTIVATVAIQIPALAAIPWILFMARFEALTRDFASERFARPRA